MWRCDSYLFCQRATTGATTPTHYQPYSAIVSPNIWKPLSKKKPSKPLRFQGFYSGAPWGIRTHDLRIRSALLYPAELKAHKTEPRIIIAHVTQECKQKTSFVEESRGNPAESLFTVQRPHSRLLSDDHRSVFPARLFDSGPVSGKSGYPRPRRGSSTAP